MTDHQTTDASGDDAPGPAIGTRFPDMVLRDQHGRLVDLHAERGHRRALVVFYRSARW